MAMRLRLISVAAISATLLPLVASAQQYTLVDLGTLGGTRSVAADVNIHGQVVGFSDTQNDAELHAYVTEIGAGGLIDLGTLGGKFAYASSINDAGQIVGASYNSNLLLRGFFTDISTRVLTEIPSMGGRNSSVRGVNLSGQMVGSSLIAGNIESHIFIKNPGDAAFLDLGNLGGTQATGFSINKYGQVTGQSSSANNGGPFAFTSNPSTNALVSLGTLGGSTSVGFSINDLGQVVGQSLLAGDLAGHAFVTNPSNNLMVDLGTLGGQESQAYDVNNSGQVVGGSENANGEMRAFIYENGNMRDLNLMLSLEQQSSFVIEKALAINDNGQVAAYGVDNVSGKQHSFLLNPTSSSPTVGSVTAGYAGTNGWYLSPVTLSWTVTGVPTPTTTGCTTTQITADTKGRAFTCTATNSVGTATQSVTVKIDQSAPKSVVLWPAPSTEKTYKRGQALFAAYVCADATSGIASCTGSAANGARLSTTTPGIYNFVVTATDRAGNTSTKTVTYQVR